MIVLSQRIGKICSQSLLTSLDWEILGTWLIQSTGKIFRFCQRNLRDFYFCCSGHFSSPFLSIFLSFSSSLFIHFLLFSLCRNDDDRVFSHSPKTRHIQEAKAQEEKEKQGTMAPPITRDTRNIAALAASRRQRLATIPQQSPPSAITDAYLTPSRLAKHDRCVEKLLWFLFHSINDTHKFR